MNDYQRFFQILKENEAIIREEEKLSAEERFHSFDIHKKVCSSFHLCFRSGDMIYSHGPYELFRLDTEDIQYLVNKYQSKLVEEFLGEMDRIKEKYGSVGVTDVSAPPPLIVSPPPPPIPRQPDSPTEAPLQRWLRQLKSTFRIS
ncbi:hypothetical protein [Spirosoma sordidisoli]|uniref:Uncharacterized protein n=1 Tax=Spirosoma sordidisoli TaxID=2502893 RepID=A0A4Q2UPD8_9BACT|nr:hypothetical protein [Spirosoma sordidisoli]RYC69661.1 hypothetical protein EQG79_13755 [Spirosoma sordidisoli]